MNALDVMMYGQRTALRTLAEFPEAHVYRAGACGWWSVKEIICHLASFEQILAEVFAGFTAGGPTPYLDQFLQGPAKFNDDQIPLRAEMDLAQVLDEFHEAHTRALALAAQISPADFRRNGAVPWYGAEYDLEDFIAYMYYGHKREHSAQIAAFRDVLEQKG